MDEEIEFPFSLKAWDYPNMGLMAPLKEYEDNWYRMHEMTDEEIMKYADAVVREGINHEKYVRIFTKCSVGMLYDQNPTAKKARSLLNFGHIANLLFVLNKAPPEWIDEEHGQWIMAFVEAKKKVPQKRRRNPNAWMLGRICGFLFALLICYLLFSK